MFLPTSALLHKSTEYRLIENPYSNRDHSKYREFAYRGVDANTNIWAKLSTFMFGRFAYSSFNGKSFVSQDCHLYDEHNIIYTVPGHIWCSNKASVAQSISPGSIYYLETNFNHNILSSRTVDLEGSFFLTHPVISNFGHDLCQVIPWIHAIATKTNRQIYMPEIVVPGLMNLLSTVLGPMIRDLIIPLPIKDNEHVNPKNGYFCDTLSHNTGGNYLRSLFFSDALSPLKGVASWYSKGSDKLLLMRGGRTRIANSDAVKDFCVDQGFHVINPLETSVTELIVRLQFAKVVIVEPGASINNLFFAPHDAAKIILWPSQGYTFGNPWWNAVWPTATFLIDSDVDYLCSPNVARQVDEPSEYSIQTLADLLSKRL